jgi:preprotein translocase subunit SecE
MNTHPPLAAYWVSKIRTVRVVRVVMVAMIVMVVIIGGFRGIIAMM